MQGYGGKQEICIQFQDAFIRGEEAFEEVPCSKDPGDVCRESWNGGLVFLAVYGGTGDGTSQDYPSEEGKC